MAWKKFKESIWLEILLLIIVSALVYLLPVRGLTYYRDDWYYMYDGLVGGGKIFVEMFRHLRPARGPLFELLFGLFNIHPQPYIILLYFWRLLGALGALWLFRILWPRERSATFFMALLYLLYPGFLWWVQGFEYQPMVLSAALYTFSIVFTIKAIQSKAGSVRILQIGLAFLTGWAALALVEYAIGMEVFRWICIYLLYRRSQPVRQAIIAMLRGAYIFLLIPLAFLFWHQFIFVNERRAADIGLQMGELVAVPNTGLWWFVHWLQSLLNVLIFAWTSPFNQIFFTVRLKDAMLAIGVAVVVVLILLVLHHSLRDAETDPQAQPQMWQREAIFIGIGGAAAGVIPIIISNRIVTFERFSHYALPASLAAAAFIVGLVYLISDSRIRLAVLSALVAVSVLTHSTLASQARDEGRLIQAFWQQMSWRAPNLKPGTVLLANYAGLDYREGNDVVWGPANFIYYPEHQNQVPVSVPVLASRMEADTHKNILEAAQLEQNYIVVNDMKYDYGNLLVITMPSENACVHALDGSISELSVSDPPLIVLAATRSKIGNILTDTELHTPMQAVFGEEPERQWCYFYQKAELARQLGDWQEIMKLGDQVKKLDLHPNDQIEWMPFLQAAASVNDQKQVKQISTRMNTEKLYKQQACRNLKAMQLQSDMQDLVNELFCGNGAE